MKAIRLHGALLSVDEVPDPQPGPGEIRIRVHAAGVTPSELGWYPTTHTRTGEPRNLPILGHEFSGVLETGEAVYGMNDWFADGAMAEYCITRPEYVAPKPAGVDHVRAAAIPIGALTAWQGLFDRAGLSAGQRLLVHGGAGAVGSFAVQLGRWRGAHVIATASRENLGFVRELGAHEAIDYRGTRFEDVARNVDVVFDTVGGETLARSWSVLKPGGRLVTIASSQSERKDAFFIVEPKRDQLVRIAELVDAGHIQPVVDAAFPLERAVEAYGTHARRGKMVVQAAAARSGTAKT